MRFQGVAGNIACFVQSRGIVRGWVPIDASISQAAISDRKYHRWKMVERNWTISYTYSLWCQPNKIPIDGDCLSVIPFEPTYHMNSWLSACLQKDRLWKLVVICDLEMPCFPERSSHPLCWRHVDGMIECLWRFETSSATSAPVLGYSGPTWYRPINISSTLHDARVDPFLSWRCPRDLSASIKPKYRALYDGIMWGSYIFLLPSLSRQRQCHRLIAARNIQGAGRNLRVRTNALASVGWVTWGAEEYPVEAIPKTLAMTQVPGFIWNIDVCKPLTRKWPRFSRS